MPAPSIVTLTLNPALDVSTKVDVVTPTHKLRTTPGRFEPGGGGVNVARVCHRLGETTVAAVAVGGDTGRRIVGLIEAEGIATEAIAIAEESRESFSVLETSTGHQFRFVLPGPELSAAEIDACRDRVVDLAADSACLVVSGSMPAGIDPGFVSGLVKALPATAVIVDTSGPALLATLASGATLVKPSARELATVAGAELHTEAQIAEAARRVMSDSRIGAMVVSIGPGGCIVVEDDGTTHRLRAPTVRVQSSVGAGDSMVAGLAVGLCRQLELVDTIALGVAAGTAAVMTEGSRLCKPQDVQELLPLVTID